MKKGDKLRVIVKKGDALLCSAPLRKWQRVLFYNIEGPHTTVVMDGKSPWLIDPKAVEAV